MSEKTILALNLQLFAEGGAAGADGAGEGATNNSSTPTVIYGKQADVSGQQVTDQIDSNAQTPDLSAEFDEMVKGKYKGEYDSRVQKAVNSRVRNLKAVEGKLNAVTPIMEMLGSKYGVDANDIEALNKAIMDDNSYFEQEAIEKGISVEQLKEFKRIERENAGFRRAQEEARQREGYERLMRDAEELRQIYPSFDLDTEFNNPQFGQILQVPGISLRTAYEIVHKDEIIPEAMRFAAQKAQQNAINNIIAGGSRPVENGVSSQSAAAAKTDPSTFTSQDLKTIRERVQRGEKIVL